jgi:membrane-associated phospholipid phosphatase
MRVTVAFSIFIFSFVVPNHLSAQHDSLKRKSDAVRFAGGMLHMYKGPFRWNARQWTKAGAFMAGTAAVMLADEPVRDYWVKRDSKFWDRVEVVGFHYGKPYSGFAVTGFLYVSGLVFRNAWMRDTGMAMGIGILSSGIVQTVLKSAVGRSRPAADRGAFSYNPFTDEISYHSFPGGHIMVATGISYVLARQTKSVPLKILFYSLASTTVLSRLYSDSHWLSDQVFGAALTMACSEAAIRYLDMHKRRPRPGGTAYLQFIPRANGMALLMKLK